MKVNVGCYTVMFKGWINMDKLPISTFAHAHQFEFIAHDVAVMGLPFQDGHVELINASHFLEHLTYQDGQKFLNGAHRVLQPGGCIRIAVPDFELIARNYLERHKTFADELDVINVPCRELPNTVQKCWHILTDDHKAAYDYETLQRMGAQAGFQIVQERRYQKGHAIITRECPDLFPEISLYVEMIK